MFFTLAILVGLIAAQEGENYLSYIPMQPFSSISAYYNESSQSLYFHSGANFDNTFLEGLQSAHYDQSLESWRFTEQPGDYYPDSRAYYGSFASFPYYYIFGGIGPNGLYNDMWKYDLVTQYWTAVAMGSIVSPRYNFYFTSFTDKNIFYFAVVGGKGYSNQDSLFDCYL